QGALPPVATLGCDGKPLRGRRPSELTSEGEVRFSAGRTDLWPAGELKVRGARRMFEQSNHHLIDLTRRHFFRDCRVGVGKIALASLLTGGLSREVRAAEESPGPLAPKPS